MDILGDEKMNSPVRLFMRRAIRLMIVANTAFLAFGFVLVGFTMQSVGTMGLGLKTPSPVSNILARYYKAGGALRYQMDGANESGDGIRRCQVEAIGKVKKDSASIYCEEHR